MSEISATKNMAKYVKEKAINLSEMSRKTGVSYSALYASLGDKNRDRQLSIDEAIVICKFLDIDPREFAEEERR